MRHTTSGTTGRVVATEADGRLIVWRTRTETPDHQTVERWAPQDTELIHPDISPTPNQKDA